LRRALALGLAALGAACEPAVHELAQAPSGASGTQALAESLAARFGEVRREPGFDALRPKLARAALVPSWVFDDRSAWPAEQTGEWRAVEFTGYRAGPAYWVGLRNEAPGPVGAGQYRGRLRLDRLGSGRYEWTVLEELATGPLRPADLSRATDGLLRGLEQADDRSARAALAAAFPRASAKLGLLLAIDQLALTRADGAASLRFAVRLQPALLRAGAPHYAEFLERYISPIRARVVVSDATGATWWTLEGQQGVWTLRLRFRGGSLVPLEGDAARRMPESVRMTIDYSTRMGRFEIAASGLVAELALTSTPVEKSFVAHFAKEPRWDLPFLVETLLGGPLAYPFDGAGSEAGWGVREMPSGTQLYRQYRVRVRETFILRWLGGMSNRAMTEFRAGAEAEAERYDAECLLAIRDDLVALVPPARR
jgi:hypothetical protein